jgi:hydrophobe/amphiphile efflux-1 (HAE1) family protein
MSLSSISIRNPVFAWMLMLGIVVVGLVSFERVGVGLKPDVDMPFINVNATLEGAAPEIMESDVTDVIENALMAVQGVREVVSTSRQGSVSVTAEFEVGRNIDLAFQDVQARISANQRLFPKDVDPPVIRKTNPEEFPIMWVALSGPRSQIELGEMAKNVLRDQFLTVPDTGDVLMGGYLERNMRIWLDPEKLRALDLTADDVIRAVQREHGEIPAGRIETPWREANVRVKGEAQSVGEWQNLLIEERNDFSIRLKDVAVIEDGSADIRRMARVGGVPAQGLGIIKQHGANTVKLAKACRARIAEINQTLPEDLSLDIRYDSSKFIEEAVAETEFTLLLAVLLTAAVCWLFLGSLSSTLNVVLAIPVSICGTFAVTYFCGFTLNTFTLLALMLSIGLVVDDAIMVLENIYRHAEEGHEKAAAAQKGAEQIQFAALAATLAIAAVFMPVIFMPGVIGLFFFQFGVILSAAVFISLLEALTLAPSRCSQFLRVGRGNVVERVVGKAFAGLTVAYRFLLGYALRFRLTVLVIAFAAFFSSLTLLEKIPKEESPAQDQSMLRLRLEGPVDASLDYTLNVVQALEEKLKTYPEIEEFFIPVGGFSGEVNQANAFLTLCPPSQRTDSQQKLMERLRRDLNVFPGYRVNLQDPSKEGLAAGRGGNFPITFTIRGPDWDALGELDFKVQRALQEQELAVDVQSSYKMGMPEIEVIPHRERLLAHNVSAEALSLVVSALIGGQRIAKFTDQGRRYDVRMRLLRDARLKPEDIGDLYVRNREGRPIKVSELADIQARPSMQSIQRINRERAVTISANEGPGLSQAQVMEKIERLGAELMPPGYRIVLSGSSRSMLETMQGLIFAMILGLLIAYMILASQFNSFLHPITILLALPFSVTGALLGLYWTGQSLNVYSVIGIVLLLGIVKKNSILLVDMTNQIRAATPGQSAREALQKACPIRLRPILMTSIATMIGALPGALALGPGAELRIPMSIAVICGVAASTLLTLFVVPCFYELAESVKAGLTRSLFRARE